EVVAVRLAVGAVGRRAELEQCELAAPHGRERELNAVEAAGRGAVGWRVEGARDLDLRPRRIVVDHSGAGTDLICDPLQRSLAVSQAQVAVQRLGVEAPLAVQLGSEARLTVEGRYRLAGLEGDGPPGLVLEVKGWREVRLAARERQAAGGEQRRRRARDDHEGTFVRPPAHL